ncbi:hypothetical protein EON65_15915 [archaeon]|nr:MAG: hypothetical protein EON65_15915 [archaeon]
MEELNDSTLLNDESIAETTEKNDSVLSKCLPVVQDFFLQRMKNSLEETFNLSVDITGWRTVVVKRISGMSLGLLEVDYYNPEGKKCRNRTEVIATLSSLKKATKNTPKEQHFVTAMEYREEILLAQKLALYNFTCDEIKYTSDNIVILPLQPELEHTAFFCIGNMAVISWGNVVAFEGFHTEHGIFPLGFRCLRQEHDTALNCVVDCLLEVDALCKERLGKVVYYSSLALEDIDLKSFASVEPLFRISVQWILPNGAKVVKVYEGKTPHTVWQAVKLETMGTTAEIPGELVLTRQDGLLEEAERASMIQRDEARSYILRSLIPIDSDEIALRAQLKEERKLYFKALHMEQRKGMREPLRPRLDIDNAENFVDHALMRVIEGMQGSLLCENYVFYDAREESGIRVVWKEYGDLLKKVKMLDQVIRHYAIQAVQKELMSAKPRMDYEDNDMDSKDVRAVILIAQKARSNKVRDIEKGVSSLRSSLIKQFKRRKEDIKLMLKSSLNAEDPSKQQKGGEVGMDIMEVTYTPLTTHRPQPNISGDVCMPGAFFSKLMELWVYLKAFTKSTEVVSTLTIEHLVEALTYVHPVMREAAKRLIPRFLSVDGLNDKGKSNRGRNAEVRDLSTYV